MKCHYEVLDLPKDATLTEIKSNYRKLALKWHPDKNLDNTDDAKEQFQLVQQAYEVLSDPQERAWYDKHREQILRGSDPEFQDKSLDVFPYFTSTCFRGYGDDENGFYAVYRNVFDKIIEEDLEFMEDEELSEMPRFGDSTSDYDEIVGPFYAHWSSYSTKKSYVWLDPYNINETRERRVLKLIEKENKKVRQKAKKERNEEVRNLVAFVRKRDKRVQEHSKVMEARIKENRQKQKDLSKMKRLEQKMNTSSEMGEWAKFDNVKQELEQIEKNLVEEFSDTEEEEEITDDLYCVACNKTFKTVKSKENHESSKKHKENVQILKIIMKEEAESESEEEIEIQEKRKKNKKKRNVIKLYDSDNEFELMKTKDQRAKSEETESNEEKAQDLTNLEDNASECSKREDEDLPKKHPKKKPKKAKTNKQVPEKSSTKNRRKTENGCDLDLNHCCVNCKAEFQSKNKLFDHLKKTGHGVYLPPATIKSAKKNLKEK